MKYDQANIMWRQRWYEMNISKEVYSKVEWQVSIETNRLLGMAVRRHMIGVLDEIR